MDDSNWIWLNIVVHCDGSIPLVGVVSVHGCMEKVNLGLLVKP